MLQLSQLIRNQLRTLFGQVRQCTGEVGGRTWHWLEAGSGRSEEVVVLLHGLVMNATVWQPLLRELARHRRVVVPELPGFNVTLSLQDPARGLEGLATELSAFLEQVIGQPVHLFGHSMAAPLCLPLALRMTVPVRSLVMVAPVAGQLNERQAQHLGYPDIASFVDALSMERFTRFVLQQYCAPPSGTGLRARATWPLVMVNRSAISTLMRVLASAPPPLLEHLDAVTMPVLVIRGEHDRWSDPADAAAFYQHPLVHQVVMPDCGHLPFIEQPEAFAALISRYFSALRQTRGGMPGEGVARWQWVFQQ